MFPFPKQNCCIPYSLKIPPNPPFYNGLNFLTISFQIYKSTQSTSSLPFSPSNRLHFSPLFSFIPITNSFLSPFIPPQFYSRFLPHNLHGPLLPLHTHLRVPSRVTELCGNHLQDFINRILGVTVAPSLGGNKDECLDVVMTLL